MDIRIEGMTCGGCIASLKKALARNGLAAVTVELGVAHVPDEVDPGRVERAIEEAGFQVASRGGTGTSRM